MASSPPDLAPAATPAQVDGLAGVCPYLRSVDGDYGSSEPDPDHRCSAQDPPGSLPLAFQERFCLTDRYPRCEMFKYAQEVAGSGAVPAAALPGTTAAPARRSVSLALGPGGDGSHRSLLIAAGGIGGVVLLVVLLVLAMGSCSGGDAPAGTDSATPQPGASADATDDAASGPQATATPVPEPTGTTAPAVEGTDGPSSAQQLILYEVQEGEGLLRIAETFGVTRRAILKANVGMEESKPYVETGQIINVPVSDALSVEQLEDIVGYMGPAG